MFEFRLILVRPEDKRLVLRFSYVLRGSFFLMTALIAAAMLVSGSVSAVGVILGLLTLFGALFEENWTWHPDSRTLVHRSGLLVLAKNKTYAAADIGGLELRRFIRGQYPGGPELNPTDDPAAAPGKRQPRKSRFAVKMIGLALETKDGKPCTIETHRERDRDDLALFAALLAETLNVPLREITEA